MLLHSTSTHWVSGAAAVWSSPPLKNSPDICDGKSLNDHQQIKVFLLLFIESKQIKITDIYKCIISDNKDWSRNSATVLLSPPRLDTSHFLLLTDDTPYVVNSPLTFHQIIEVVSFLLNVSTYNFLFTTGMIQNTTTSNLIKKTTSQRNFINRGGKCSCHKNINTTDNKANL